jgi:ketosteroid isomerase-like protein
MIRSILAGAALVVSGTIAFAGTPPAPSTNGHQAAEEKAVLAAMDRYLAAISASDLEMMAAMQTPDGVNYRALALPSGGMEILGRPNSYWVDPARKDGRTKRERYWAPTVLVRGSIAMVWAPYEFWIDGETSHCGVDVFNFIRVDDAWHVANSMWTVEPDACPELRPSDPASIRPAG